jgi:hypothetical protein
VLQTDTNSITQILNIQDSLEKENKKMELQQIINDKEILLTVITLENYFITWSIVFTIANKSSRIAK